MPSECEGPHATPRRSRTRKDSWRGYSPRVWWRHGGVRSRQTGFESRAGDSQPRNSACLQPRTNSVLGVCRIARDSAKVEVQVRLLARTLIGRGSQTARCPAATREKWVRLPPASSQNSKHFPVAHPKNTVAPSKSPDRASKKYRSRIHRAIQEIPGEQSCHPSCGVPPSPSGDRVGAFRFRVRKRDETSAAR